MGKKRGRSPDEEEEEEIDKSRKRRRDAKSSHWDIPRELYLKTGICQRLYDAIRGYKDDQNHLLCESFVRVPSRRSLPEYYDIVSQPIDLLRIQQKLRTEEYSNVLTFISDVRQLIDNAKLFFDASSPEHMKAVALETEFLKSLQKLWEGWDCGASPQSPKTVSLKLSQLQTPPSKSLKKSSVKATRSKAWLDEYTTSSDPIKMFLAAVYTYHDSTGEYIAQPFLELPSRKEYPEYYRIITEPLDLNMIRANTERGQYENLKAIQEDMLLMIKNAHYFNEPGSEIFKLATTLRKFIVNKCSELERRYKTMEKTVQQLTVSVKKQTSQSPPAEKKIPRIKMRLLSSSSSKKQKYSSTDNGSESDSEFTESESESEREELEGDGEPEGKLMAKVKKRNMSDHLGRVLKAKSCPSLKKQLQAIYQTLVSKTDSEGRVVSELFVKRPSAKQYPEYYIVIRKPIDLKEIFGKIKSEQYQSLKEMMDDVELLVSNACTFNEEESQVHQDALTLREVAQAAHKKLLQTWGAGVVAAVPTSEPSLEQKRITQLLVAIKSHTDAGGRFVWQSFKNSPPLTDQEFYATAKKPMDLTSISQRVMTGEYPSLSDLFADLWQLFDFHCRVRAPHSHLYKDAVALHQVSVAKYKELNDQRKTQFQLPDAIAFVKNLLKELVKRMMEYKDGRSQQLSKALCHIATSQELETGEEEGEKEFRVISLARIQHWAESEQYSRLDQLQADILAVLREARVEGEAEEVWKKREVVSCSLALERQYVLLRDELCGKGKILWSPSLEQHTLSNVDDEYQKAVPSAFSKMNSLNPMLEPIPPEQERVVLLQAEMDGVVYIPGEFVYLPPREPGLPFQIVLIERVWKDRQDRLWVDGCWFCRPRETFHVASRKFYEKEVFKSDFTSSVRLSQTQGKCCVLFLKDYIKFFPEGFTEDNVFLCESRYSYKHRTFRKIKAWNIIHEHSPNMFSRPAPLVLSRVPSVFASGGGTSDIIEQQEPEAEEVMEQDSVLDKIGNDSTRESSPSSENDSNQLDLSFFKELEDIPVAVPNPEDGCTYYEQFCIDDKVFHLGHFVYVRSDQELPFIARIDRMWTDADNDPWFRGPWFVRVKEVHHLPTRMFFPSELFLSNIQDTNPMRSIIRKCAVLPASDYCKWRPTEIPEADVFICESRYNEADKEIRRHKGLKYFPLTDGALKDEIYYLPHELQLQGLMEPSPHLMAVMLPPPPPPPTLPMPPRVAPVSTTTQQSTPTLSIMAGPGGSQLTVTLQQLQALLAAQITSGKPQLVPLALPQQPIQPAPTPSPAVTAIPTSSSVLQSESTVKPLFSCMWGNCGESFENSMDLMNHMLRLGTGSHISREVNGDYFCRWTNCPRHKQLNGRPFDTLQKITRHVKEVHLMRAVPRQLQTEQSRLDSRPRPSLSQDQPIIPAPVPTGSSSTALFPQTPMVKLLNPLQLTPQTTPISNLTSLPVPLATSLVATMAVPPVQPLNVTATPLQSLTLQQATPNQPPVATAITSTVLSTGPVTSSLPIESQARVEPMAVDQPTLREKKSVVHSSIYMNYIKRMRNNESYMTSTQPMKEPTPQQDLEPSQWLDPASIPPGLTVVEALKQLHDHLMQDSLNIQKWLEDVT